MREAGGPSLKTSSRFMPVVRFFKSSAVTAGGGGGGGGATVAGSGATGAVGVGAALRGAAAARRVEGACGGAGTESAWRDWTFGTPGPTSRIGSSCSSFLPGGGGTSPVAALEACLSTLLKIVV